MKTYLLVSLLFASLLAGPPARANEALDCNLHFSLSSWSLIYEHVTGKGVVTCNNG